MDKPYTFKNKRGANIAIGDIRQNTFNYYSGCTVDVQVSVYSDDFKTKFSFWLLDHDTGWTGDSIMDGLYENELDNNEEFDEDMELSDLYSDDELEEMAWNDLMGGYEFYYENCPFLDYINRIEDVVSQMAREQYGKQEEEYYDVCEEDLDILLATPEEDIIDDLEEEDLIDYEAMAEDDIVYVEERWGEKDYSSLVEDFELNREKSVDEIRLDEKSLTQAAEFCRSHDATCLALPLAVCSGMLSTSFVQPRGLLAKVSDLINDNDWSKDESQSALLQLRSLLLSGLKGSRWVDRELRHYERYSGCVEAERSAYNELKEIIRILSSLCEGFTKDLPRPFAYYNDCGETLRRLKDEYDAVLPHKLAYDFLVDAALKEKYIGQVFHQELTYYQDSYDRTRLSFIRDEVFKRIDENLGKDAVKGILSAAAVYREYPGETFVQQLKDAESDDDSFEDLKGLVVVHGIHYECSDYYGCPIGGDDEIVRGEMTVLGKRDGAYKGVVHIPGNVMFHGRSCPVVDFYEPFKECEEVTEIVFGEGITSLEHVHFRDCLNLQSVTIPASVTTINYNCFDRCKLLTEINVNPSNTAYAFRDGELIDLRDGKVVFTLTSVLKERNSGTINFDSGEMTYSVEDGTLTVSGCLEGPNINIKTKDSWTRLVIAEGVQSIGDGAFSGYSSIRSLSLPSTLKRIEMNAFEGCKNLEELYLPDGIEEVQEEAFARCSSLRTLTIGAGVKRIGRQAFWYCTGLKEVTVLGKTDIQYLAFAETRHIESVRTNEYLSLIDIPDRAFPWGQSTFELDGVYYKPGWKKDVGLTAAVVRTSLQQETLTIPETVSQYGYTYKVISIDKTSYYKSTSLKVLNIPSSVLEIKFGDSYEPDDNIVTLTEINVDAGNPNFASSDGILYSKDRKQLLDYPARKKDRRFAIPDVVEEVKCSIQSEYLEELYLSDNVRVVWTLDCPNMQNIYVSESNEHFSSVDGILYTKDRTHIRQFPQGRKGEFIIPENVTSASIESCSKLTRLVFPKGFRFGSYNFYRCNALKDIEVAEDNPEFTSVDGVLYSKDMKKLIRFPLGRCGKFVVPDGVETIAGGSFNCCGELTAIEIPDSVTAIEGCSFIECSKLASVSFGNGLKDIGRIAFKDCVSLETLLIPDSVEDIYRDAFCGCANLKKVRLPQHLEKMRNSLVGRTSPVDMDAEDWM